MMGQIGAGDARLMQLASILQNNAQQQQQQQQQQPQQQQQQQQCSQQTSFAPDRNSRNVNTGGNGSALLQLPGQNMNALTNFLSNYNSAQAGQAPVPVASIPVDRSSSTGAASGSGNAPTAGGNSSNNINSSKGAVNTANSNSSKVSNDNNQQQQQNNSFPFGLQNMILQQASNSNNNNQQQQIGSNVYSVAPLPFMQMQNLMGGGNSNLAPFFQQNRLQSDQQQNQPQQQQMISMLNQQPFLMQQKSSNGIPQSQFRGVSWDRSVNTWRCKVNSVHVGYFDSELEAARAYDEATLSLHQPGCGMQLRLNFPLSDYKDKPPGTFKYTTKRDGKSRGTSQYRGVLWDKASRSWRAKIKHKGHTKYLGLFRDEAAAARAYDKAAYDLRGSAAKLNFPHIKSEEDDEDDDEGEKDEDKNSKTRTAGRLTRSSLRQMSKGGTSKKGDEEASRSSQGHANSLNRGQKRSSEPFDEVAQKYARITQRQAQRREVYHKNRSKLQVFHQSLSGEPSEKEQKDNPDSKEGLIHLDALKIMIVNAMEASVSSKAAKEKNNHKGSSRGRLSSQGSSSSSSSGNSGGNGGSEDEGEMELSILKKIAAAKQGHISVRFSDFLQAVQGQVEREILSFLTENKITFKGQQKPPQNSPSPPYSPSPESD